MWFIYLLELWKRCNSGTTVACALFRLGCVYTANVGDSAIILGTANPKCKDPNEPEVIFQMMTRRHTPHDEHERKRIEALGGSVMVSNKGILRVVWERKHPLPTANNGPYKELPKLNITRSLGDLWSITEDNKYLISPMPFVYVHHCDPTKDKYIILGSDGLWDMIHPQRSVEIVHHLCKGDVKNPAEAYKIAEALNYSALNEWDRRKLTADNVSVIIGFFEEEDDSSVEEEDDSSVENSPLREKMHDKQLLQCHKGSDSPHA